MPAVPVHEAEASARPGPLAAAAVVAAWPPPVVPEPEPVASAFVAGPADATLCAR